MVRIMHSNGYDPYYTLVEYDKLILQWAIECFEDTLHSHVEPVCADALYFMQRNKQKYDFVFLDVFNGRVVPEFVCSPSFLEQCRDSLTPGGRLAFNYIVNDTRQWEETKRIFEMVFPNHKIINFQVNRILISH